MFTKIVLTINLILILITLICEHKNLRSFIFWGGIVFLFSVFGFFAYIVFGNRLKFKAKRELLNKQKSTKNYLKYTSWYKSYKKEKKCTLTLAQKKLTSFIQKEFNCPLWHNNTCNYFVSGQEFLKDLLEEINFAKQTINLMFYIFDSDTTGKQVAEVLKQKAKQGVVVNVIYDAIGSKKANKHFFEDLTQCGINVFPFFPSLIYSTYFNFKANYRNHKKIVVIDGRVAYTGGINLRDDHMSKCAKLSPWRDTQIKIKGHAVYALQNLFLNDLFYLNKQKQGLLNYDIYFPKMANTGQTQIQILESGPEKENNQIKQAYLKIIQSAKQFLFIQTPYFIVDDDMLNAITLAKKRGVSVNIVLPQKPDKKIVYAGTLKCIKKLFNSGVNIYLYKGFIHSKVLLTEHVLSVGSCNFDNRSFELNFEVTSLIYNPREINKHKAIILSDIKNSTPLTKKIINKLLTKYSMSTLTYFIAKKLL